MDLIRSKIRCNSIQAQSWEVMHLYGYTYLEREDKKKRNKTGEKIIINFIEKAN